MTYNGKHPAQLAVELDPVFAAIAARARLPAFSVDIEVAGTRVSRAYRDGPRPVVGEERPVFAAGCLMDIFLAILCIDMHDRRGLDLDAPFETILPELAPLTPAAEPITIRQLLTRTGGLQDPRTVEEMSAPASWETLAPRVRDARRLFSPGVVFNYGGIDRIILALLLERLAGTTLERLTRESLVEPSNIHIRDIQLGRPQADGYRPIETFDGSTLLDILAPLARKGAAGRFFSESVRNYLQIEQLHLSRSVKAQPWPHAPTAFTFGLFKYSDGLIGFNGWEQNQSCAVRLDPMGEVSFVVALEGPPIVRDVVVAEIAQRLGYESIQSRAMPCTVGGLNGLAPKEVVGVYSGWAEGYQAEVALDENILTCELSYRGERFRRICAQLEEDAWLTTNSVAEGSALEFFLDHKAGRVCMASGFLPYAMS